jgi:nitroimidazol reductase NimA-like FMN-containing flavoprotein (pyridoxamine 5'-phosphate oxidase superfamily)
MNRQSQIKMTPEERNKFLAEKARTMMLCTIDKDGFPHAVAMAYMLKDDCVYMTSFKKAQKVVNVRRNPKVAVMVETGTAYNELKGVMIRGRSVEDHA